MAAVAPTPPLRRRRWTAPAAVGTAAVLAVTAVAVHDPFRAGAWPTCPFHAATGLWCPLCGSTRALYAILHDHPALMAASNPLLPLWAALAVWGWLWWASKLGLLAGRVPSPMAARWVRYGLVGSVAVFWVARNLPGLGVLAPHGRL
jgi:hypothetical protein